MVIVFAQIYRRILQVEKGSFTPLIYTTYGGWGPQATRYHKRLATLIAKKSKDDYSAVMSNMRVRVRFELLRSILIAVRGVREKATPAAKPLSVTDFSLIPESLEYESY